jgi:hypothetical protein
MKFPVPHDVKAATIPGTEGWERMYPYQYQFVTDDPVRNQYEKEMFWFYDGLHYPEPLYPLRHHLGRGPGSSRCRSTTTASSWCRRCAASTTA